VFELELIVRPSKAKPSASSGRGLSRRTRWRDGRAFV